MGRIYKNGINYSGGVVPASASVVSYDNTTSNLIATNVQTAVDELAKPTFTEATTLANIVSGESQATLWGKVKKMFSFIGTTTLTTTAQTITTAINELVGINAYATGSPTYVANVTALLMAINKASKQKNCSFALTINTDVPAYTTIFTLPIGFRPTTQEVMVCNIKNNATYQCAYIDVLTNGNVSCSVALSAGNQIFSKITCV